MARGKPVSSRGGSVRVTTTGRIDIDLKAVAQVLGAAAVGHVLERCDEGLDVTDKPFVAYSPEYAAWLALGGEDPSHVDIRLTGGLLNSVAVRAVKLDAKGATITIGPGTGTSEVRRAVKGRVTKKGERKPGRMAKTGHRGPPHNVVGAALQARRRWLGVSPKGLAKMRALLERRGIWKGSE
jgi:hypothetical protein